MVLNASGLREPDDAGNPCPPGMEGPIALYFDALSHLHVGHLPCAMATMRLAVEGGLDAARRTHFEIETCYATGDWSRLSGLVAPDTDFGLPVAECPWIRIAIARLKTRDVVGALLAMSHFSQLRPGDPSFLPLLAQQLTLPEDDPTLIRLLHGVVLSQPDTDRFRAVCAHLRQETQSAIAFEPFETLLAGQSTGATKLARDWASAVYQKANQPRAERPSRRTMEEMAEALQWALDGDFGQAVRDVEAIPVSSLSRFSRARRREILRILRSLARAPKPSRATLGDDTGEVLVSEAGDCHKVAVVFTGLAERVSGVPISVFDRLLANAGYRSLFLRDSSRRAFTCGIGSLAATARETVKALRPLIARKPGEEMLVIGTSGGGYASLRYGLALDADRIAVLSGGTLCRPEDLAALGDDRVPMIANHAVRLAGTDDFTAPVSEFLPRQGPCPSIDMHYCDSMALDRAHAQLLAGFPTVSLRPTQDETRHNIILKVLENVISLRPQPCPA